MDNSTNVVKRHPVIAFYILAFAISWLGWIPQALYQRGLFPFDHPLLNFLGGGGPTIAAVIVILVFKEKDGIRKLFTPLFKLRVSFWWFVFAFGFWAVVTAIALGIGTIFGQVLPAFGQSKWVSLLPIFVMMLLSNVWEEIGWRGFALPHLQENYSDLKIVFITGIMWHLWHLPLMLNPTSPMSTLPWYGEIIFSLSLSVIYTWLYLHTNRSLFFVSVFHAMSNTMAFVLLELGVFVSSYAFVVGIIAIFALVIILIYGPMRFIKTSLKASDGE
jgi:membrane protease YdiL (CAAX protease family)